MSFRNLTRKLTVRIHNEQIVRIFALPELQLSQDSLLLVFFSFEIKSMIVYSSTNNELKM